MCIRDRRSLAADAIIFDLEDAVSPEEKPGARDTLAQVLAEGGFGARARIVRINGLDSEWGADDLARFGTDANVCLLYTSCRRSGLRRSARFSV